MPISCPFAPLTVRRLKELEVFPRTFASWDKWDTWDASIIGGRPSKRLKLFANCRRGPSVSPQACANGGGLTRKRTWDYMEPDIRLLVSSEGGANPTPSPTVSGLSKTGRIATAAGLLSIHVEAGEPALPLLAEK